jgi:feruloyl esterase
MVPWRQAARVACLAAVAMLLYLAKLPVGLAAGPTANDPAAACAALARLTVFPIAPTVITQARFNPAGPQDASDMALPAHCQIDGIINKRIGSDGNPYGDGFEVRLPVPDAWNGRFMFQGGGGWEGSVPPAIGQAGSLTPTLSHGWAVASQDGGHEASQLPAAGAFFLDRQALIDQTYRSIDVTTQTAKYLINAYYGAAAQHSYWVGCSTGGRQAMVMAQHFPGYFDGIVAGDPVYDLEALLMSEDWVIQQFRAIAPKPLTMTPSGLPIVYPALPKSDQELFSKALLQACDGLDGTIDGVIDDQPGCERKFKPGSYIFADTHEPLQCRAQKTPNCLSREQVAALEAINRGPRGADGRPIRAPAGAVAPEHADDVMQGYAYDGGFMSPAGIPSRALGAPTTAPGDFATGLMQIPYLWIQPVNLAANPVTFDFNHELDKLTRSNIQVTYSTSLDLSRFKQRGGKIIWYHGASDPGPPVSGTIAYFEGLAAKNGGMQRVQDFARLYLVPNMGHCRGGPATDQFDMLTPLVAWVEQGIAPAAIQATGRHFVSQPTVRSRPLCPYPQQARYTGGAGGDLARASNYRCVAPGRR